MRAGRLTALLTIAACATLAPPAQAVVICVPLNTQPGCPPGGVSNPDLQDAVSDTTAASDGPDQVFVSGELPLAAALTVTGAPSDGPLEIIGQGTREASDVDGTRLEASTTGVLNAATSRPVTVRDLTLVVEGPTVDVATISEGDVLDGVDLEVRATVNQALSIVGADAEVTGSRIYEAGGGGINVGIHVADALGLPASRIVGMDISGALGETVVAESPALIRRSTIESSSNTAVKANGTTAAVINTELRSTGASGTALSATTDSTSAQLVINHVTAIGPATGTQAFAGAVVSAGNTADAEVTVRNSIARDFPTRFRSQVFGTGTAEVTASYSNLEGISDVSAPLGTITATDHITDAEPGFVNFPTDLSLGAGADEIDAGDSDPDPIQDLLGNLRPVDGDLNGSAIRDQGAYEYQPPPPPDTDGDGVPNSSDSCPSQAGPASNNGCPLATPPTDTTPPETTITQEPKSKSSKKKATFKFSSSEDGSTFECKFDKKDYASCTSPKKYKKLGEGRHKFRVRAIDAAGNVDATSDTSSFKVTN